MTVKEINELTWCGGNGRNVYVAMVPAGTPNRVTRARTRGGKMQVKILGGDWVTIDKVNFTVWAE